MTLSFLIGPLVGAVIGYCTNYIAIKMLFRPRKAYYIGKFRLPLTPGVIPKNQSRLANAVGDVVEKELVTKDAILAQLKESGAREQITKTVVEKIYSTESTLGDWFAVVEKQGPSKEDVCRMVSAGLNDGIKTADFIPVFEQVGEGILGNLRANPMIGLFLNDDMISAVYEKMNQGLHSYMEEKGEDLLSPLVQAKMEEIFGTGVADAASNLGISESLIAGVLDDLFSQYVDAYLPSLLEKVDVRKIVCDKINSMEVAELERLVLSVMKQELQTVINLGALIGAIIGIVNSLV